MSRTLSRPETAAALARRWNAAELRYAVVHGIEGYPASVGRDLDVIVDEADVEEALTAARSSLVKSGWEVVEPPPIWGRRLVGVAATSGEMFEVHLQRNVRWRNVVLADRPDPVHRIGPFAVDPWAAWAKRALIPVLCRDETRVESRKDERRLAAFEEEFVVSGLRRVVGGQLARRMMSAVRATDPRAPLELAGPLRRAAVVRAARRHPLATVAWPLVAAIRRVRMPFAPCAPVIALVGPDGVGKSTIVEDLLKVDGWVFLGVETRHWRPAVLPRLGAYLGRPDPGATGPVEPRRSPGPFPWLRVLYYAVDIWLGAWLSDRPAAARQRLVVYDRCFLDMAVDPLRYGLRSPRGVLALWHRLPHPDRIIALSAEPTAIHARKQEIPVEEIARQLAQWRRLERDGHVDGIVDAGRPPEQVLAEVRAMIVDAFLEVNGARGGDVAWGL